VPPNPNHMGETNQTYSEKLKSPLWQMKRLEIFQRDNWTCVSCNRHCPTHLLTMHVHHIKYLPNLEPWEYDNSYLATYCELCHNTEHLIGDQINESLVDLVRQNKIFIKPVSQLAVLVEKWPEFADLLKWFVDESMISYLKTLENSVKPV
jgi:hypothetical protein